MTLLDPRVWLTTISLVALAYFGGRWQQSAHDKAKYEAKITASALDAARVQIKAVDDARQEEQRRAAEQMEIADAAKKDVDSARADARNAGAAADGLRKRVNELLASARAGQNSTAPSGGAPAANTDELLAELFRRADETAGSLAADLDASRIAGLACERSYDVLTAITPVGGSAAPAASTAPP